MVFSLFFLVITGCGSRIKGNIGQMAVFRIPTDEAEWIRAGEPIEFEGELWYPRDGFDVLIDAEVFLLGEYQGVQFFAQKLDVRPYNRLYTKFGKNKFRAFEKNNIDTDDQDQESF